MEFFCHPPAGQTGCLFHHPGLLSSRPSWWPLGPEAAGSPAGSPRGLHSPSPDAMGRSAAHSGAMILPYSLLVKKEKVFIQEIWLHGFALHLPALCSSVQAGRTGASPPSSWASFLRAIPIISFSLRGWGTAHAGPPPQPALSCLAPEELRRL